MNAPAPMAPVATAAQPRDDYSLVEPQLLLHPCPVCASSARLWRYSAAPTQPSSVAAMCDNGSPIGPQDGIVNEGCLLYMPPDDFYRSTIRDATAYWNSFAGALEALQRKNRWARVRALRSGTQESTP